jgi:hypothetical protein
MQQVGLTVRTFASKSNWRTLPVCPENHPTCGMHQPRGLPPTRERLQQMKPWDWASHCRNRGSAIRPSDLAPPSLEYRDSPPLDNANWLAETVISSGD